MHVLDGNRRQYCPEQAHDGRWGADGKEPPTPSSWPFHNFAAAATSYHAKRQGPLPELDIDLGGLE
jgi:hypothetical protein